jgi:catechol 2,3-dioxygenase-like lactoylglutathione lyase family enzyme
VPDGGTLPFRREKGLGWEGGFRAPFLIHWSGNYFGRPGTQSHLLAGRCGADDDGRSGIKLLKLDRTPTAKPPGGGIVGGLGYRYFTISVPDIQSLMAQLEAKGIRATVPIREARPGVTIAMVTDPDSNTLGCQLGCRSRFLITKPPAAILLTTVAK